MLRIALVALLAWSSGSLGAGIDEHFAEGALGLQWGATLQQVREAYPGGLSYTLAKSEVAPDTIPVKYAVDPRVSLLGLSTPCGAVDFFFTKAARLKYVTCYFQFSERDTVLYEIAEELGQDYVTKDDIEGRTYSWRGGRSATVSLRIGRIAPFEWVYLSVRPIPAQPGQGK